MSNKNNRFGAGLGWFLLIVVILTAVPIPPLLFLGVMIVLIFRIPRCLWDKYPFSTPEEDKDITNS